MKMIYDKDVYNKVISKINENLSAKGIPFNITDLLYGTDAIIFGGAVRDSICPDTILNRINDIDILSFYKSTDLLKNRISFYDWEESHSYLVNNDEYKFSVFEDKTKFIQLINISTKNIVMGTAYPKDEIVRIINGVDLSNCGLAIMPQRYPGYIIEFYPDSFRDVINGEFRVTSGLLTEENRLKDRITKFKKRGWKQIISNDSLSISIDEDEEISFDEETPY